MPPELTDAGVNRSVVNRFLSGGGLTLDVLDAIADAMSLRLIETAGRTRKRNPEKKVPPAAKSRLETTEEGEGSVGPRHISLEEFYCEVSGLTPEQVRARLVGASGP